MKFQTRTFMVINSVPGSFPNAWTYPFTFFFNPHNNFMNKVWLAHSTSEDTIYIYISQKVIV